MSHRIALARAAIARGDSVVVVCRARASAAQMRAEGIRIVPFEIIRGSLNPIAAVMSLIGLWQLLRRERPDVVHLIALQPVVLGGIAARLAGQRRFVAAIAGLGFTGTSSGVKARLFRKALTTALRWVLRPALTIVQNNDDRAFLLEHAGLDPRRVILIGGSGVDLELFRSMPQPRGDVVVAALVARMISIKGIADAVEAARRLHEGGARFLLRLVGPTDPANPSSIPESVLRDWAKHPAVQWEGRCEDVPGVWRDAAIAVLPSLGGEGVPRSLLEAAACGRPIVTTDVPGCRDVVRQGENGLVVPPGDPQALAAALKALVEDASLRERYGAASRRLAEDKFSEDRVVKETFVLYDRLLSEA